MEETFEREAEQVDLSGLMEKAVNENTKEDFASKVIADLAPDNQQKRFLGEDESWNPVSSLSSSNMDVRLEDKSKEMSPHKEERRHISKQAKVSGKKEEGQKGDLETWANSIPGKRSNDIKYPPQNVIGYPPVDDFKYPPQDDIRYPVFSIKYPPQDQNQQDQVFESTNQNLARNSLKPRDDSTNQVKKKSLNNTQQRRSYSFNPNTPMHEKGILQLAREALSYTLTTPPPQTVNYSYKKTPRRPRRQKSNHKKSFGYQPSSYDEYYQTPLVKITTTTTTTPSPNLFPPLSYAQPSHQCKTKVLSQFFFISHLIFHLIFLYFPLDFPLFRIQLLALRFAPQVSRKSAVPFRFLRFLFVLGHEDSKTAVLCGHSSKLYLLQFTGGRGSSERREKLCSSGKNSLHPGQRLSLQNLNVNCSF